MNLLNLIRPKKKKEEKIYPYRYVVRCSISHPRIVGHISTVLVTIDAHNSGHARRQLKKELKLTVGKVIKSSCA